MERSQQLEHAYQEAITLWCQRSQKALKRRAKKRLGTVSGALEASIEQLFSSQAGRYLVETRMNASGRYREMRSWQYKGPANFEGLLAYVKAVGLDKFKFIPRWKEGRKALAAGEAERRIAWGIAWARYKDGSRGKAKPWFSNFYNTRLQDDLIDALLATTGKVATLSAVDMLNDAAAKG